ncbi:G-protein coupled receptor Mth2 isoform X1 [Neodiprion lecontei]|uniref:G-protein coupled receptor Mth2 isoform X1 n=1 Tax=Neodiprion lecontei TaxID=441921 RepID=A0A6J0BKK0_NEOLC|nr:G-protein coupled receptor Mth2 isoform X1 [Neodiprion lecontei]
MRKVAARSLATLVLLVAGIIDGDQTPLSNSTCPASLALPILNVDEIVDFKNGSISYEGRVYPAGYHRWDDSRNLTLGCVCELPGFKCVRKCCPGSQVLNSLTSNCSLQAPDRAARFPVPALELPEKNLDEEIRNFTRLDQVFYLVESGFLCQGSKYLLEPTKYPEDDFVLDSKGALVTQAAVLEPERYCLDWLDDLETIRVIVCYVEEAQEEPVKIEIKLYPVGMIVSLPFLLATFLVYAIIPELRNVYGMTLMCYVASLLVAYTMLAVVQLITFGDLTCIVLAFVIHFSFLASFFWLNVMCVDIWWTFAGYRSIQGSVRQRERKKFILYSIYAWGCACLLTGICIIMEYAPGIPSNVVRPEFGVEKCWFKTEMAKAYYFYIPMGLTVLCNIILFILTAAKIIQHKKNTAHQLKGTESRRHDDNKQWFNLYLKLFIVMGINWSMEIISWAYKSPEYLWYITDLANTLQGVIIFIIFVWKEKIKRLLIKRFGCKGENFLSRDSTRSAYHSSTSRTCTTSVPLNEKTNSCPEPAAKYKSTNFDDSDGA